MIQDQEEINRKEELYWESKEEFDWIIEREVKSIINNIPEPIGNSLELCSGSGMFTRKMNFSRSKRYVCLDISRRLLYNLKERLPFIETVKCDAQRISLPDNSFNNVYVFAGLHHLPDIDSVIKKSYSLLRSGGKFICFEPNNKCFYRHIMLKLRKVLKLYTDDEVFLNPQSIVNKLEVAGFRIDKVKYLTPSYKLSHIKWQYPLFMVMKLLALIKNRYFQSFFIITCSKPEGQEEE